MAFICKRNEFHKVGMGQNGGGGGGDTERGEVPVINQQSKCARSRDTKTCLKGHK